MLEKKRLSVQPTFHNTRFFFAFSERTQLWLPMVRRKWENSLGKIGKMEGKEKALEGKITKYPVVPSEIRTHNLRVTKVQYLLENRSPPLVPSASPSTFAKRSRRFLDQNQKMSDFLGLYIGAKIQVYGLDFSCQNKDANEFI